ncbi:hypothetical protein [Arthrobacter sp. JUb115]|uniref:hypothetical protein n=1 Tax=Arthrobacter sp. JUb115 TaxID=2485108 RepID=UPI00105F9C2B|nr:hypothetical protein [Arthrobacter sp. JUb115]TDU21793.1 hypothetical protein EDF61_111108 [Arthrobacter sp. JUb115]
MLNIFQAKISDSTLDDITSEDSNRRRRLLSLAALLVIAAFVLAALLGAFDQKKSMEQQADGFAVQLQYPAVVRAGNEIQLRVEISSANSLPETITLDLSEDYLMLFEDFSAFPEPESESSRAELMEPLNSRWPRHRGRGTWLPPSRAGLRTNGRRAPKACSELLPTAKAPT